MGSQKTSQNETTCKPSSFSHLSQLSVMIPKCLHQDWAHLRRVQTHAVELREGWLEQLTENAVIEMKTSKENALKQMAREAKLSRIFRKRRPVGKGINGGAIVGKSG